MVTSDLDCGSISEMWNSEKDKVTKVPIEE
jgi:hypothetical protein